MSCEPLPAPLHSSGDRTSFTWLVTCTMRRPCDTPGPAITSGTWADGSSTSLFRRRAWSPSDLGLGHLVGDLACNLFKSASDILMTRSYRSPGEWRKRCPTTIAL